MDDKERERAGEVFRKNRRSGRVLTGIILVGIGTVLLLDQLGFYFPEWLFKWHFLLIVFGIFLGFRHGFRGGGWLIMILIGGIFLIEDTFPGISLHRFTWPVAIIVIGLFVILRPHRKEHSWKEHHWRWEDYAQKKGFNYGAGDYGARDYGYNEERYSSEDYIDSTTICGGVHKRIVSKNFKGGDVTSIMGGTEINLTQADFTGVVVLDVTQVMGGTKLIVPPHWEIRSEISAIFAGFEDKREQTAVTNPDKILLLKGTSIFGGIEIKNYA
ncbi:MAG: LiaF-related protein [Puia sp.]|nr:LiaF-related protein [Puia sp.]